MIRLTAHYDGKVLVPEQPVDLPRGVPLDVTVQAALGAGGVESLLKLEGMGAEVWDGVDPVEYQRREREGWE
jgi:hypothetical protein